MTTRDTQLLKLNIRLRQIVEKNTRQTRRNTELEEMTGIPATQWSNWWSGKINPSAEMLMMICTKFPEQSLWLMTGREDPTGGQISPNTPEQIEQKSATRLLRRVTEIYNLKNEEVSYSLRQDEVDEINDLHEMRKKELLRRLNQKKTSPIISLNDNAEAESKTRVDQLINKIKNGWTFHDCLFAKFIGMSNQVSPQTTKRLALRIGITAFEKKLTLHDAYKIEEQYLHAYGTAHELEALEEAKHLLNLKSDEEI